MSWAWGGPALPAGGAGVAALPQRDPPTRPAPGSAPSRPPPARALQRCPSGEQGRLAQLLLDAEESVVLGHPIRPGDRPGLDLPRPRGHGPVRDGRILRLA